MYLCTQFISILVDVVSPGRNHEVIAEGSETDDFWNGLGGKGDYSKSAPGLDKPILEPRLFHCRELANGKLRAFEINDFKQEDLVFDDVLILDSGDEIYVWIGKDANANEREKSMELAKVRIL